MNSVCKQYLLEYSAVSKYTSISITKKGDIFSFSTSISS